MNIYLRFQLRKEQSWSGRFGSVEVICAFREKMELNDSAVLGKWNFLNLQKDFIFLNQEVVHQFQFHCDKNEVVQVLLQERQF